MLKFPKTNTFADRMIERTSSMLDEIASKTMHKDAEGDSLRKEKQDTEWGSPSQKHK